MPIRAIMATFGFAALVIALLPISSEGQPSADATSFNGTWRYAGSPSQGRSIISRAVDRAVEPMNMFQRGPAAGRLRERNPLARTIAIEATPERVRIVVNGSRTLASPLGQWTTVRAEGNSARLQIRYRNGALVQLLRSDNGMRRNVYRDAGEGRMRLEVTVQADALPRDLTYRLMYRR